MSTSNTKPTHVFLAAFITFFILLLNNVNSLQDIAFSYSKFKPNAKDLLFDGGASVSSTGVLSITKVVNGQPIHNSIGRARFVAPVQIWDKVSGKVASFTTSFTFTVRQRNSVTPGDGFTFFLAPPDSRMGAGSKFFGLFNGEATDPSYKIVAVEFDTAHEGRKWDPNYKHIGIDVNGISSIKTVKWDWRSGQEATVTIKYVAATKILSASLTYPSDRKTNSVSASVDLKAILTDWVRVGFSGATPQRKTETHDVYKWDFASTFKDANSYVAAENNSVHVAYDTAA